MKGAHKSHAVLILAATVIAYLNSFFGVFQFDDYNVIVYDERVHTFLGWFEHSTNGIRPLLKFSFMLNWTSGQEPFRYHLFNLLVHGLNAVLVYLLAVEFARRHLRPPAENRPGLALAPLLVALLFALHTVADRGRYLHKRSLHLVDGSVLAYVYGIGHRRAVVTFIASPLLFLMAILTKETWSDAPSGAPSLGGDGDSQAPNPGGLAATGSPLDYAHCGPGSPSCSS
jgi:protein O-mannosyl-transferase